MTGHRLCATPRQLRDIDGFACGSKSDSGWQRMQDVESFSTLWAERLGQDALALGVIDTLWGMRESFAAPVIQRARDEGPVIDAVIAGDLEETTAHVLQHFRSLLALPVARLQELGDDPMAFVRRHGVRRAQAGVPLLAVLQAYRTGHKSFWSATCTVIDQASDSAEARMRTTMLLSEYLIDYTDLISIVVTDAYLAEQANLAEERTLLGIAVVEDLLAGIAPRGEEGQDLCERSGLAAGLPMTVVVVRASAAERGLTARALGTLARELERTLPRERFGRLVGIRGAEVIAIVAAATRPGERAAEALRASVQAFEEEAGSFRIGVGLESAAIPGLLRSYSEALTAIKLGSAGGSVSHLAEFRVATYLLRTADETARRLAPKLGPSVANGELARTLEAFAAADLNVKACARALGVHSNTIYHRLNRVRRLTGLDPRSYASLSDLMTAIEFNGPQG